MSNALFKVPEPYNEPVLTYKPGSVERATLQAKLADMQVQEIEVPLVIGGQEIRTGDTVTMHSPHNHQLKLGVYHQAGEKEVALAIESALAARAAWARFPVAAPAWISAVRRNTQR